MPSTRASKFLSVIDIEAEVVPTGSTTRALPPASAELNAPAGVADRSDARRRREHPAKVGRPSNAEAAEAAAVVFDAMKREMTVPETAARLGAGQDGRRVKELLKTAREVIRERIGEYVDIHLVGAKVAALKGDTRPAEWALENLDVDGERVVTAPNKNPPQVAPTFNLGFMIGGIPAQAKQLPAATSKE
jgi:hypothetical protein